MAAETKTSVAARFANGAYVSAQDFSTLIDSYQDKSDILLSIATAAQQGGKGFVYVSGSSTTTFYSAAAQGLRVLNTATTAAAQQQLGGGTVGRVVFEAATTALALGALGGSTVGAQILGAANTAAVQSITLDINSLTEDTTPEASEAFIPVYDSSAASTRKVAASRLSALSNRFVSSDQTITLGGSLTLAHGLPTTPYAVFAYLVCVTGENGYSAGQLSQTGAATSNSTTAQLTIVPDSTNINIRYPSAAFTVGNYTTGATASITVGNWRLRIIAYA